MFALRDDKALKITGESENHTFGLDIQTPPCLQESHEDTELTSFGKITVCAVAKFKLDFGIAEA